MKELIVLLGSSAGSGMIRKRLGDQSELKTIKPARTTHKKYNKRQPTAKLQPRFQRSSIARQSALLAVLDLPRADRSEVGHVQSDYAQRNVNQPTLPKPIAKSSCVTDTFSQTRVTTGRCPTSRKASLPAHYSTGAKPRVPR